MKTLYNLTLTPPPTAVPPPSLLSLPLTHAQTHTHTLTHTHTHAHTSPRVLQVEAAAEHPGGGAAVPRGHGAALRLAERRREAPGQLGAHGYPDVQTAGADRPAQGSPASLRPRLHPPPGSCLECVVVYYHHHLVSTSTPPGRLCLVEGDSFEFIYVPHRSSFSPLLCCIRCLCSFLVCHSLCASTPPCAGAHGAWF